MSERPVVLLDKLAELFRHLVGPGQHDGAGIGVNLPPQAELEALQAVSYKGLESRQFLDVLIDPLVLKFAQRLDDLVELTRIDILAAQHTAQVLSLVGVLTGLASKLPDVLGGQTHLTTLPPATPGRTAAPLATAVNTAAGEPTAVTTVAIALTIATTGLLAVALPLTLALPLPLLALLPLALPLTLLALTLLTLLPLLSLLALTLLIPTLTF